ncbi:acyl-CoA dehydrogenase family protein [Azospirillum rugosum]|uniref:(2S)-methylsuccinyl-CoA dehydrogenase n=1 Tax=Azospirillum rugosum TaxID=416170 RepID=A0ABS4SX84_9PROT|nr:acyl-CoA dehydrogenase family protein [Azospirillum rugosum]MBP2295990.1 (2S)-methylsuccinyl-CoA dehydrogenase [Azospirillum rugosum]MDQ0529580.1 (2S)-methylsuccinyl-CoA dehydrogenase [Azospirillum rugosum]
MDLLTTCRAALAAAETLATEGRRAVAALVTSDGRPDARKLETHQFAVHGLAWQATYVAALRQTLAWAEGLKEAGTLGEVEAAILRLGFAEYLGQLAGGIPMSQAEVVRPSDLGIAPDTVARFVAESGLAELAEPAALEGARRLLGHAAEEGRYGALALGDETLEMMHGQFTRFADAEVAPLAQDIHRRDVLIPLELVEKMAGLGVFGLTVPEEHGGLGLGKIAMCLVSEVLSRAYLGVGSLGTRAEIAAELIRLGGTAAQKERWLPRIASGEILPTAVFTEPNTGSDLGSLRTRAVRDGDVYRVFGAKTWITHGARSDLMTLLVRTDPGTDGYAGLSMLLAEKPRGTEDDPFPAPGMSGTEIPVLGYRGMKEYEIAFDGFEVPADALLGGVEGQGFKQLMETFESARIQTAARALGVAQNALELGTNYAHQRSQFGKPILAFPRVHAKIAWMAAETMMARQLAYFAAREKDSGRRCDVEAGMAKLLAARVAWSNADAALQIHGGNGYALEYPISRVLCDARILSIFEGAAEIQAQVIARGLLTGRN